MYVKKCYGDLDYVEYLIDDLEDLIKDAIADELSYTRILDDGYITVKGDDFTKFTITYWKRTPNGDSTVASIDIWLGYHEAKKLLKEVI